VEARLRCRRDYRIIPPLLKAALPSLAAEPAGSGSPLHIGSAAPGCGGSSRSARPALDAASGELAAGGLAVTALPTDVTERGRIAAAKTQVAQIGPVSVLMCNAGREWRWPHSGRRKCLAANTRDQSMGCSADFPPRHPGDGFAGRHILTGSKQGITLPPGDPATEHAWPRVSVRVLPAWLSVID
jgi:NAD(P)-dependent dehydrogenase (short-subunit alcohol dehydrogenase family)